MNDQTVRLDQNNEIGFLCCLTCWIQKAGVWYGGAEEYKHADYFDFYQ